MIKIDKKIINTDIVTILRTLKSYIAQKDNKEVLHDIVPTYGNVMVTCPYHKNGKEKKPSCGVSTIDQHAGNKEIPAGTVHCFTCGKTASLDVFISYLLGFIDSGEEGRKWLFHNFETSYTRQIQLESFDKEEKIIDYIPDKILDKFRYYHPYMYKRGLTNEVIEKYDIGYDEYSDSITFPVRDKDGNCVFIAKRSVKNKFFILPKDKDKPLYGVYELDYSKPDVYICESFFNALTLAKWGFNAIALMGVGSVDQYKLINKLPFRTFHIVLDGDLAGKRGTEKLAKAIRADKIVFLYDMYEGKDVNDLTFEQFKNVPFDIRT